MIITAGACDASWAADLTARAFEHLASAVWLVPSRDRRREMLTAEFRIVIDAALRSGEVHRTEQRDAVAVWLPCRPGATMFGGPSEARHDGRRGEWADRFRHLTGLLAAHHPEGAHHHLAFMAVEPQRRGEGLGSALLRAQHARLDAEGVPAYLVSGNPAARDLYARHGYRAAEPVLLPDGAPFWPMWRDPGINNS